MSVISQSKTQAASTSQTVLKQDMIRECQITNQRELQSSNCLTVTMNYNEIGKVDTDVALTLLTRDYKGFSGGHEMSNGIVEWERLENK